MEFYRIYFPGSIITTDLVGCSKYQSRGPHTGPPEPFWPGRCHQWSITCLCSRPSGHPRWDEKNRRVSRTWGMSHLRGSPEKKGDKVNALDSPWDRRQPVLQRQCRWLFWPWAWRRKKAERCWWPSSKGPSSVRLTSGFCLVHCFKSYSKCPDVPKVIQGCDLWHHRKFE